MQETMMNREGGQPSVFHDLLGAKDQGAEIMFSKFVAPTIEDFACTKSIYYPIRGRLNVISSMKEYMDKSLEELRHEYYQVTPSGRMETNVCAGGLSKPMEDLFPEHYQRKPISVSAVEMQHIPLSQSRSNGLYPGFGITTGTCSSADKAPFCYAAGSSSLTGFFSAPKCGTSVVFGSMSTGTSVHSCVTPSVFGSSLPNRPVPPVFSAVTSGCHVSPVISTVTSGCHVSPVISTVTSGCYVSPVISTVTSGCHVSPAISTVTSGCHVSPVVSTITSGSHVSPVFSTVTSGCHVSPVISTVTSGSFMPLKPGRLSGRLFKHPKKGSSKAKFEPNVDLSSVFGRTVKATQTWFEEPAIEAQISCAMCLETYMAVTKNPVALPSCGHTFCRPCLQSLEKKGSVECPTCMTTHSGVAVSEIPILHSILSLSEAYRKAKVAGSVLERCESHGDQLCIWCRQCSEALCGLCLLDAPHHQCHKLERIISIADIDSNVEKQARNFFEYSAKQQTKIMNELQVVIKRVVELSHMSNTIESQVKTISDVMKNKGNKIGIKLSMQTLTKLDDALKFLHQTTDSLSQESELKSQVGQPVMPTQGIKDSTECNGMLTIKLNQYNINKIEESDCSQGAISQIKKSDNRGARIQVNESDIGRDTCVQVNGFDIRGVPSVQVNESHIGGGTSVFVNKPDIGGDTSVQVNGSDIRGVPSVPVNESHIGGGTSVHVNKPDIGEDTSIEVNRSDIRGDPSVQVNESHIGGGTSVHVNKPDIGEDTSIEVNRSDIRGVPSVQVNESHIGGGTSVHVNKPDIGGGASVQVNGSDKSGVGSQVKMLSLTCCGRTSDGRQMNFLVENDQLHLCALEHTAQDVLITIQVPLLERFLSQENPEVFFELSVDNKCLGRVYIQLWGHMRRAKHFLALCLGTLGPSYKGSKFDKISDWSQPGEVLHCMGYSDKTGPSSKGLTDNLEWGGEYRQLQKAGQLIASGGGQAEKDGSFGICTKDNLFKTFSCPFGVVVSGMDVVCEAVNHVGDVVITEVGAVATEILY